MSKERPFRNREERALEFRLHLPERGRTGPQNSPRDFRDRVVSRGLDGGHYGGRLDYSLIVFNFGSSHLNR